MMVKRFVILAIVALSARVAVGQTSAAREPVGVLEVSADQVTCGEETALRLWELHTAPSGARGRMGREPIRSVDCKWTISDLAPGTYQADLIVPTGSAGTSEPFSVRAREITRIVIAPASVIVVGQISVNGKPLAAASLEFNPRDRQWGPARATTDTSGRYAVHLARPGQYDIFFRAKSTPTAFRNIDVVAGSNSVDWAITGGRLTVRVSGMRPGLRTTVRIESRRVSHNGELGPGDEPLLTIEGLDFETYSVSATQGDALVSAIKTVQLDASQSAATVNVELIESHASLVLADAAGNPVRNARVRAVSPAQLLIRANWSIQPTAPGVYPLDSLSPGTYLLIRAEGFVATCRTVPLNSTVHAVLEAGRSIEVQLPTDLTPAVVRELAALTDIPGSDCPVPLSEFAPNVKQPVTPGQPPTFEFRNFPSTSRLGLMRFGAPLRQIVVPDHGDVVVERF